MYRNILVPVDLDQPETWAGALSAASPLAKCFSAKLTLGTVVSELEAIEQGQWSPLSMEQLLFDARARLEGVASSLRPDLDCGVQIAAGTIAGGVLEIAGRIRADLILLASHRPALRDRLMAANAIRIARRASCSVLIARPTD